jgi:ABC-type transport system involved in cytochrome bd biosynthesis fused ATPase/permease subunit
VLAITHREAVAAAMDRTIRLEAGRVVPDELRAADAESAEVVPA